MSGQYFCNTCVVKIQCSFWFICVQSLNIYHHFYLYLEQLFVIVLPVIDDAKNCSFHLFVIRTNYRDELKLFLESNSIETGIHYPIPPHLQKAYSDLGYKKGDFPIAESMSKTCLSLPLYPGLTFEEVDTVCDQIKKFFEWYIIIVLILIVII